MPKIGVRLLIVAYFTTLLHLATRLLTSGWVHSLHYSIMQSLIIAVIIG